MFILRRISVPCYISNGLKYLNSINRVRILLCIRIFDYSTGHRLQNDESYFSITVGESNCTNCVFSVLILQRITVHSISNNLKYTIRTLLWYSNIPHTVQAIDCKWLVSSAMNQTVQTVFFGVYCKTLNVSVPFISRISRAKQNRKTKGSKYQLQAKIGRNYYSISNCMVLIRQNKRGQNNYAC